MTNNAILPLPVLGGLLRPDSGLESILLPVAQHTLSLSGTPDWLQVHYTNKCAGIAGCFAWEQTSWPSWVAEVPEERRLAAYSAIDEAGQVELDIALYALPEGYVALQLQVRNVGGNTVTAVTIKPLRGMALSPDWYITVPWGGAWGLRVQDIPEKAICVRYPVQGCLQWIEFFHGANGDLTSGSAGTSKGSTEVSSEGLSVGTLDPVPMLKDFSISRTDHGVDVSIAHPHLDLKHGESVTLPPVFVGIHRGDWQQGAVWYRQWLQGVVNADAPPDWLLTHPLWCWASMKEQLAEKPDMQYQNLPDRSAEFSRLGLPVMQVAAWLENGHDTRYPDYVAGACMGGEPELLKAATRIHEQGNYLALYTNGRIVDPLSATLDKHPCWPDWTVRAPQGKRFMEVQGNEVRGVTTDVPVQDWDPGEQHAKEQYGKVIFGVMCPSAPHWQDVLAERLEYLAQAYQVDGIYIDQVLGAEAMACYAPDHDHEKPNLAWAGYHGLMRKVRHRVKVVRPQAYLATEGISDLLGQYFDLVQSHNDWRGVAPPEAFPFPELTRHAMPWLLQACGPIRENDFHHVRLAHYAGSGMDIACRSIDPESLFAARLGQVAGWRARFGRDILQGAPLVCTSSGFPRHRATAILSGDTVVVCSADSLLDAEPEAVTLSITIHGAGAWRLLLWETEDSAIPATEQIAATGTPSELPLLRVTAPSSLAITLPPHEMGLLVLERMGCGRT